MSSKPKIFILSGPTASGKTGLALEIAKEFPIEIISADSRQIYKYMDIGTAKPTKIELEAVTHHFVNTIEPNQDYSAGQFGIEAKEIIKEILTNKKLPIVAGGSGLYINAIFENMIEDNRGEQLLEIRKKLNEIFEKQGIDPIYQELTKIDPISAEKYSDKNPRRIIRALEYFKLTGIQFSASHFESKKVNSEFESVYFYIDIERDHLYDRINKRVDIMIESGLVNEVENILNLGYDKSLNALNTVGYKEIIAYLDGVITIDQAIDKIKQFSRNYAKRQITWFKKVENKVILSDNISQNLEIISTTIKNSTQD